MSYNAYTSIITYGTSRVTAIENHKKFHFKLVNIVKSPILAFWQSL